jgi:hypothetical protein
VDGKRLHRLSGLQTPAGAAERVQREIHVEPDDSSGRVLRHTGESCAPDVPQFLSPGHTVAVHGHTLGVLDEFVQINMATYSQAFERKHVVPLDTREALIREVQRGLAKGPRSLAPWMLYDGRGSRLFDRITTLPEYYPTRTERGILARNANAIIAAHTWDTLGAQSVGFAAGLVTRRGNAPLPVDGLPQPQAIAPDLPGVAQRLIALWR